MKTILVSILIIACSFVCYAAKVESEPLDDQAVSSHTVDVLPVRVSEGAQSLNGEWKFKYLPSINVSDDEAFFQSSFDATAWKTMPVPGHWELHGVTEPQYGDGVKEG